MDLPPLSLISLRLLAGATYALQLGLLVWAPIPNPVSTRRLRPGRPRAEAPAPPMTTPDRPFALLLPLGALAGVVLTLMVAIRPDMGSYILPEGARYPDWLPCLSGIGLVLGNAMIASAVFTLRRRTKFDTGGQSVCLVTGGVFGLVQHPIVSGMGLLYAGFFMALPSPLILVGLACYGLHQKRRLAAEEVLLAKQFGRSYRHYQSRVGRFWPRCPS